MVQSDFWLHLTISFLTTTLTLYCHWVAYLTWIWSFFGFNSVFYLNFKCLHYIWKQWRIVLIQNYRKITSKALIDYDAFFHRLDHYCMPKIILVSTYFFINIVTKKKLWNNMRKIYLDFIMQKSEFKIYSWCVIFLVSNYKHLQFQLIC